MLSPSTDPIFSDYETGEETEASDSETKEIYGCHTEENPGFEEEDGLEEAFDFSERFVHEEDKEEHLFASVLTSRSQSNKTHSSETTLPSAKRHGVKGKKTFGLPLDRASFKTFIDNNTTLDDKGYPLLPNGNTVYVRKPGQAKVTNWGTFGFAYTTSGGGTSRGPADWRTVWFSCLGVIVCKDIACDYLGSPPTAGTRRAEWLSRCVFDLWLFKALTALSYIAANTCLVSHAIRHSLDLKSVRPHGACSTYST